jgi:hypothetical protein
MLRSKGGDDRIFVPEHTQSYQYFDCGQRTSLACPQGKNQANQWMFD